MNAIFSIDISGLPVENDQHFSGLSSDDNSVVFVPLNVQFQNIPRSDGHSNLSQDSDEEEDDMPPLIEPEDDGSEEEYYIYQPETEFRILNIEFSHIPTIDDFPVFPYDWC